MKSALIFPDVHKPFHSKKCWDLCLKLGLDMKTEAGLIGPDEIIFLGDYLDFINLSMHGPKDPRIFVGLKDEITAGNFGLDQIDQLFPNSKKVFVEGNHEFRLERFILKNAIQLFGITDIKNLLEFDRRNNWTWVPYGTNQKYSVLGTELYARHVPWKTFPHLSLQHSGTSTITGHDHKIASAWRTDAVGKKTWAGSGAWLGNPKSPAFSYMMGIVNWQWGISTVYAEGKDFWPSTHRITDDYKLIVNGKLYKA